MPKKRLSAGVLFLNSKKEILLVKPVYREGWLLPGGVIDEDESPRQCAEREVKEELGLSIMFNSLLIVDYLHKVSTTQTESIHFLFKGHVLLDEQVSKLKVTDSELKDLAFFNLESVESNIVSTSKNRLAYALHHSEMGKQGILKMVNLFNTNKYFLFDRYLNPELKTISPGLVN